MSMDIARASIRRRTVVLFLCFLMLLGGVGAYVGIGKLEDPAFTIKTAVVTVVWPGATVYEVEREAASRMEDAVQAMGEVKRLRTRCTPGVATLYVDIKDSYTARDLPQVWNVLRKKVDDARASLPSGCTVYANDDFGDVFGQYYALTGDGFTMKELRDYADFLKKELVLVPGVARVSIQGEQSEAVWVEFSTSRLRSLGMSPSAIFSVLNEQNTISSMGRTSWGEYRVTIEPTGGILSVEDIGDVVVGGGGGRLIRLNEVATVRRGSVEPQSAMMSFDGRPALGIGIATVTGGNVVEMGEAVSRRLVELEASRPIGMELDEIYMQSKGVVSSIRDFVINLLESLAIVVGVLLVFMGMRSGLMIGVVLLLTVAGTLMIMQRAGIFLQQVSLAALIIALGSLVDNAIVVAEGMLVGVQRGQRTEDAASDTVGGSMWAMLGGTFIAVLAFAPIGLSPDNTGEYCRSLLQVVGISMMLSWLLAITVTPALGTLMLRPSKEEGDPYRAPLFRIYRALLEGCLRYRIATIAVVLGLFAVSVLGFTRLDKAFFPSSTAMYFLADLWQREGTSIDVQRERTEALASRLRARDDVEHVTAFTGSGGLRFMLTYSPPDQSSSFSELLVQVKEGCDPAAVLRETQRIIDEETPEMQGVCKLFAKGSGMAPVIEARFYGDDPATLRELARQAREIMEADPDHNCVRVDWRDPVMVFRPRIRMDRMQSLGLTRPQIDHAIMAATTGHPVGAFRDGDRTLPILLALAPEERGRIESLKSFPIWAPASGTSVALGSIISDLDTPVELQDDVIMRRDRRRVLTVASDVRLGASTSAMQERILAKIEAIPLPPGHSFEWGGEKEGQANAMAGMSGMFVPCLLLMFTIMVFLFNGFRQPIIIFVSIPLISIGVFLGLALSGLALDFLSIVGVLSLVGMLAKNSIVLLDQVATDFASGKDPYQAIVDTGVSRLRPVAMSAVTTVLGMIPLIWDVLFGPMAVTIMGGLTVSTILTMIFIPVATAIAYGAKSPKR